MITKYTTYIKEDVLYADADGKLKKAKLYSIKDMSSGMYRGRNQINAVYDFQSGYALVELYPGKYYRAGKFLKGKDLKAGMLVSASYNAYNQGIDFYEIKGVTDMDEKYGNGGIKFDSVKEALQKYKVKTLKALEELEDVPVYGHGFYLFVEDLDTEESGPWFYLDEGRWCRGSGAEKLTFVELIEVELMEEKEPEKI